MAIWRESDKRIGFSDVLGGLFLPVTGLEVLSSVELTSATTYIEFSDLDGTENWFYVLLAAMRGTQTGNYADIIVNGQTDTTQYECLIFKLSKHENYTITYGPNGAYVFGTYAPSQGTIAQVVCAKALDGYFRWFSIEQRYKSGDPIETQLLLVGGVSKFTLSNISSLGLRNEENIGFAAGSRFVLLGLKRS